MCYICINTFLTTENKNFFHYAKTNDNSENKIFNLRDVM